MKVKTLVLLLITLGIGLATASQFVTVEAKPNARNIREDSFKVVARSANSSTIVELKSLPSDATFYFAPEEIPQLEKQLGSSVKLRILDHGRSSKESEVLLEVDSEVGLERFHYTAADSGVTPLGSSVLSSKLLQRALNRGFWACVYFLIVGVPVLVLFSGKRRRLDAAPK